MDHTVGLRGRDVVIDVENSVNANRGEEDSSTDGSNMPTSVVRNGTVIVGETIRNSIANEDLSCWGSKSVDRGNANDGSETNAATEKPPNKNKKNNCKKPPRPPRPTIPLDAAEEKFVREISQLAVLKRARIERRKAAKKINNTKTTSSTSNIWAFIITVIFCLVIFWQGFNSRSNLSLNFEGSPVSSVGNNEGLISIQYHNNASGSNSIESSLSPSFVEQVSGSEVQGDESVAAR